MFTLNTDTGQFIGSGGISETGPDESGNKGEINYETAGPAAAESEALLEDRIDDDDNNEGSGNDDVDFGRMEDFHVVTNIIDVGKKKDKIEEYHEWLVDKLKEEYLPCFINKFADLGPSEIKELGFVKEDTKLEHTIQQLHNIFNTHEGSRDSYMFNARLYAILADYDGLFFAFRKLLEILFQNNLSEEGFDEPHSIFRPSFTFMTTCLILNAVDSNQDFARKVCQEPGMLELFVWLLRQMKDRHLTKTRINEVRVKNH
jgi:hypothetical protein